MTSRICENLEVLELLNCLRSTQDGSPNGPPNVACPERTVRETWTRLRRAWWTVALRLQEEDAENGRERDLSLLNWPAFIKQQIPLTSLKVVLHAVHSDDWARAGTKSQLAGRLISLSIHFKLGLRTEEPWLLFLYLGQAVPLNIRTVRNLNAWINENSHIETDLLLSAITEQAIRRHGNESDSPPQILNTDVEAAMNTLSQQHARVIEAPQTIEEEVHGSEEANTSHVRSAALASAASRRRAREEGHDILSGPRRSVAPTPEVGRRRTSYGTPLLHLDVTPNLRLSPSIASSRRRRRRQTSQMDIIESQRLEKRLEALRVLVELGPTAEINGESFVARQTRGLLDSIVHLSHLALEGLQRSDGIISSGRSGSSGVTGFDLA